MKLVFVIESIVEQDILDKVADILCDRIELMKDKFFEIYQRQEFDHVWKVNVQYKKEMNIPNYGISIGKLCGKGVLGKYYNKLGHVKLDVWFLDKKPEFHNGAYDMYINTVSINCFVKIIDGIAVIDRPFIKSVLVHEMRHALEYRLYGKKAFNQVTRQTLSKYSGYLGTREEVSARISQVMLGIRNLIETGQVNKDNLNSKILEMMDRYKLHHIFDTQNYFAQGEEMELFGRKMMRGNILFAPHDNKQFRKLFNKIYVYAIHCLERIQKNEIE